MIVKNQFQIMQSFCLKKKFWKKYFAFFFLFTNVIYYHISSKFCSKQNKCLKKKFVLAGNVEDLIGY